MEEIRFTNFVLDPEAYYVLYLSELKGYGIGHFLADAIAKVKRIERHRIKVLFIAPDILDQYNYENIIIVNRSQKRENRRQSADQFMTEVSSSTYIHTVVNQILSHQNELLVYMFESNPHMTLDQRDGISLIGPGSNIVSTLSNKISLYEILRIRHDPTPVIATAIHAGHTLRPSLHRLSALSEAQRLQEEDPFTDLFAEVAPAFLIATQSRFEADLNRPRDRAVYRTSEDAWGLSAWTKALPWEEIAHSLREYDLFYSTLKSILDHRLEQHKRIVVLDIHSYNHRRKGPKAPFDDPIENPEINIGTGTLTHREAWGEIIDPVKDILENGVVTGRFLDVRENVKFKGGEMAKWIHTMYPESVLCLSLEFKKIFMNEWTGKENHVTISEIKELIGRIVNFVETIL